MTREEAIAKLPLSRWYGDDAQRGLLLDFSDCSWIAYFRWRGHDAPGAL